MTASGWLPFEGSCRNNLLDPCWGARQRDPGRALRDVTKYVCTITTGTTCDYRTFTGNTRDRGLLLCIQFW